VEEFLAEAKQFDVGNEMIDYRAFSQLLTSGEDPEY